ncbi:hypothetical protein [Streptomyces sp. 1222.5]|uniref:hypothetical protein n=1 Tax=Streptomyces sp. 1222.5 TaxID=1881026 RepID=UPI003D75A296
MSDQLLTPDSPTLASPSHRGATLGVSGLLKCHLLSVKPDAYLLVAAICGILQEFFSLNIFGSLEVMHRLIPRASQRPLDDSINELARHMFALEKWLLTETGSYAATVTLVGFLTLIISSVPSMLLFSFSKRLGLPSWSSLFSVALFELSCLSVNYYRVPFPNDIAMVLVLVAFCFAVSKRRNAWDTHGAGIAFGCALFNHAEIAILAPALFLSVWQYAFQDKRQARLAKLLLSIFTTLLVCHIFTFITNYWVVGNWPQAFESIWPSDWSSVINNSIASHILLAWPHQNLLVVCSCGLCLLASWYVLQWSKTARSLLPSVFATMVSGVAAAMQSLNSYEYANLFLPFSTVVASGALVGCLHVLFPRGRHRYQRNTVRKNWITSHRFYLKLLYLLILAGDLRRYQEEASPPVHEEAPSSESRRGHNAPPLLQVPDTDEGACLSSSSSPARPSCAALFDERPKLLEEFFGRGFFEVHVRSAPPTPLGSNGKDLNIKKVSQSRPPCRRLSYSEKPRRHYARFPSHGAAIIEAVRPLSVLRIFC